MPPAPPLPRRGRTPSLLERERLDESFGGPVSALDAAVHEADEVVPGMLSGELHPAAEGGFGGDVQHGGILSDPGAGITAEREGIAGPEEGRDGGGIETFGHLRRHLGKI